MGRKTSGSHRALDQAHLDFVKRLTPILAELRAGGINTPTEIASVLNIRGEPAPNGKNWSALQVVRVEALFLKQSTARFPPSLAYIDGKDKPKR
ncbi:MULTISPECIES: hypothetical protein [Methylobacterium]|uniref:hypothetical protein n=1 Tax=Methylobacterium TaxID=407 RepID=UPI001050C78D|nr:MULTISPECIES: hypothetical protein [Methylobacterium]MDR7038828.1 hypothetical protein [Methylobacterium sp. BE186]